MAVRGSRTIVSWKGFCEFSSAAPLARFAEEVSASSPCWRRLRGWDEGGVWLNIWRVPERSNGCQQLKWGESFLDGSFAPEKKGAQKLGKPSGVRGRSGGGRVGIN